MTARETEASTVRRRGSCVGRRLRRGRRGQSMVELALLTPVLALLLLGAVDLSRLILYSTRLSDSVIEGGLYGTYAPSYVYPSGAAALAAGDPNAYNPDPDNVLYRVQQKSKNALGLTPNDISVTCYNASMVQQQCGASSSGDSMLVTAGYTFKPLTGQITRILGNGYRMRRSVRVIIQ
jgi:Flp pilus assembly protein TadG